MEHTWPSPAHSTCFLPGASPPRGTGLQPHAASSELHPLGGRKALRKGHAVFLAGPRPQAQHCTSSSPPPAHLASTTHSDTSTSCKNRVGSGEAETAIPRFNCGEVLTKTGSTAAASDKWNGNSEPWAPRDALRYSESPWLPLLAIPDNSSLCGEMQVRPALRRPGPPTPPCPS